MLQISFPYKKGWDKVLHKYAKHHKKLYFAFIDYEKAFDSVWQTGIRKYPDCYDNVPRTAGHDYYAELTAKKLSGW